MPLGFEDGAARRQPCRCPAPSTEAAGAEERRVCVSCSELSGPRRYKAPGEEGESGQWGRRAEPSLLGRPLSGRYCRRGGGRGSGPEAPGLTAPGSGGARGELGGPQRAPDTCAGWAAARAASGHPRLRRLTPAARRGIPIPLRERSASPPSSPSFLPGKPTPGEEIKRSGRRSALRGATPALVRRALRGPGPGCPALPYPQERAERSGPSLPSPGVGCCSVAS